MTSADEIIQMAAKMLDAARFAFDDLNGNDESRRVVGLRNLTVFGHSTITLLKNLGPLVGGAEFNRWCLEHQGIINSDPLIAYFAQLRRAIGRQERHPLSTAERVDRFSIDVVKQYPRPTGAKGFFYLDEVGGSGWEFVLPDGSVEKYYVDLPTPAEAVNKLLLDLAMTGDQEQQNRGVQKMAAQFISTVAKLLESAGQWFSADSASKKQRTKRSKLPPCG